MYLIIYLSLFFSSLLSAQEQIVIEEPLNQSTYSTYDQADEEVIESQRGIASLPAETKRAQDIEDRLKNKKEHQDYEFSKNKNKNFEDDIEENNNNSENNEVSTNLDFTGKQVSGSYKKPMNQVLTLRKLPKLNPIIPVRDQFDDKIMETIKDLP